MIEEFQPECITIVIISDIRVQIIDNRDTKCYCYFVKIKCSVVRAMHEIGYINY